MKKSLANTSLNKRLQQLKDAAVSGVEDMALAEQSTNSVVLDKNSVRRSGKISRGALLIFLLLIFVVGFISYVTSRNDIANKSEPIDVVNNEVSMEALSANSSVIAENVVVHVLGAVAKVGVVEVAKDSRIVDVLYKAGGALPEADLTLINLARKVVDGEQIYVLRQGEQPLASQFLSTDNLETSQGSQNGKVNLNTAGQSDLETLPGIGPTLAQRIIDWRQQNVKFSKIEDLKNVSGIGNKVFATLENLIIV